jgi:hypothetical protein
MVYLFPRRTRAEPEPPSSPLRVLTNMLMRPLPAPSLEGLINPGLLVWAPAQSRMDLETAAAKIHQTPELLAKEAKRDETLDIYPQLEEMPPEWTIQIRRNASAEDAATTLFEPLSH